ncbi:alanine racemase [Romeria aff. gracilis LEGE 07310]|uniref:Alanine racemase n=1 Tax=Vasconcelosia minhoensis LEGE 07310 TaxID=915328 RepID=A0A8J7AU64_9CYAN|nr:alanine racemase [Romeria gracilis]MBE9076713.1 alanine racemase [Romeria aff. gracilis LEGE 07310]
MLSWEHTPDLLPMRGCRAWIEINLTALAHNVQQFKTRLSPQTDLMAVVKADAYGHGAVTVAQTALQAGATWLGVATVPEGIELRQAGIAAPILVMGAVNHPEEVRAIALWQLQPTLVTPKQALVFAETLATAAPTVPLPVHLKLDTGMARLGFDWQRAGEFISLVRRLPQLDPVSLYSHLATADSPEPAVMRLQQQRFEQAIADLRAQGLCPPRLHLANSAGTLAAPDLHYDLVRVGIGLYGFYPAPHLRAAVDLQPVMEVKARVTHLNAIAAGTGVSYGHQFIAPQPLNLAVVGVGYADGVPRILSNRMAVLVRGQRLPQVGAITMDQMMIDVTSLPDLQVGEPVTLLGQSGPDQISAEDWAALSGTISWEILCGFKHRLPRITVETAVRLSTTDPAAGLRK